MASVDEKLQLLMDKQELWDLCCLYCRGLDRLDKALLRSVYHDDATDDRGFFAGTADEFCDLAINLLKVMPATQHQIGNAWFDVQGDVAFGETYFTAYHLVVDDVGTETDFFVGGRYIDRFERRAGVWKIAHRKELNDWTRTEPAANQWLKDTPAALRGARKPDDLSYHRNRLRLD